MDLDATSLRSLFDYDKVTPRHKTRKQSIKKYGETSSFVLFGSPSFESLKKRFCSEGLS